MRLSQIVKSERYTITTEFLPPKSLSVQSLIEKVATIASQVNAVNIPELRASFNSAPSYRMNSFYAAWRVREKCGVETVFHLTNRDSNRNALNGIIRAAADAGLQNILAIGGDKYNKSEEPMVAKNVFDYAGSVQLIRAIKAFDKEFLDDNNKFCVSAGANPSVVYEKSRGVLESELSRLTERQDARAELIQTQPVFDLRCLEFIDSAREAGVKIPIMLGVIPLRSVEDAHRIEARFGIIIPELTKDKLKRSDPEQAYALTLEFVRELASHEIRNLHVYPREQPKYVSEIGRAFREKT